LIRLSLLPAAHARTFQRSRLRPSRPCYGAFSLATGRSRGFGPHARDFSPVSDSLSLRLRRDRALASPQTCTRRPIMQKVRRHTFPLRGIVLRPLVSVWFQVLLTRLIAVLFIVQSPYSSTIGHRGIFSLGRWAARLHTRFHESRATLGILSTGTYSFRIRDSHPLWCDFPDASARNGFVTPRGPSTPGRIPVWAVSAFARRY
jgi:hypothetical protein